jgi:hypothetical protein
MPTGELAIMLESELFLQEFRVLDRIVVVPERLPNGKLTVPGYNDGGPGFRVFYEPAAVPAADRQVVASGAARVAQTFDLRRHSVGLLGAAVADKWLAPGEWGDVADELGLVDSVLEPADRGTESARERGIGVVFSAYIGQHFVVETPEKRRALKLERGRRRFSPGQQPSIRYRFTTIGVEAIEAAGDIVLDADPADNSASETEPAEQRDPGGQAPTAQRNGSSSSSGSGSADRGNNGDGHRDLNGNVHRPAMPGGVAPRAATARLPKRANRRVQ